MNDKPLEPWVISEENGKILASHCTCMAGLGETCTHVAALLFSVDAAVQIRDSQTCTQTKAYWLLPTEVKSVQYLPVKQIDFTSAKTKKKIIDKNIAAGKILHSKQQENILDLPSKTGPLQSQIDAFYKQLHDTGEKCAILSLIEPYSDDYQPNPIKEKFPKVLTELRDEKCISMNYKELVDHCEKIKLSVTKDEIAAVENATRGQSDSKLWFRFRSGRITASKVRNVCKTDPCSPSQSLIKGICYPEQVKLSTTATSWGCEHEKTARKVFQDEYLALHENAEVRECGFFIHKEIPYIGASPDGIICCDCCGQVCLEIKCPYCKKDKTIPESIDREFCLEEIDGTIKLKHSHQYYYQIQTQLAVTKLDFSYFVVWTKKMFILNLCQQIQIFFRALYQIFQTFSLLIFYQN